LQAAERRELAGIIIELPTGLPRPRIGEDEQRSTQPQTAASALAAHDA
jgi:hypothetical protein